MSKALYNEPEIYDSINVLAFINDFALGIGVKDLEIDERALDGVIVGMRADFPHCDGAEEASPFKKAANFLCYFVAERPIVNGFPEGSIGESLRRIHNHQNALIGFLFVCKMLHKATIHRTNGETLTIENPIRFSKHTLEDVVEAFSVITPQNHFKVIAVLLEQLAYKTNPDCQYPVLGNS
ncbi:MAG: hypothetical protein R3F50_08045 [Gammaproteobacteria bacterium]|jgi:hypothetical protein